MTNPVPGDSVTLTPLPDYPGLHPDWSGDPPHYERAWEAQTGDVIRVRYTPVITEPGVDANMPLAPTQLQTMASASLVDEAGQVLQVAGRGLVRPAMSFAHAVNAEPFDQHAFLLRAARIVAEDLLRFRDQVVAADMLLPPLPVPEGGPA